MLNLITDTCFPVIRKNGDRDRIAIWQISQTENPVVDFDAPRFDFKGSMHELAIGLLQTFYAPKRGEWESLYWNPPNPEVLKQAFTPAIPAFELYPESGAGFMQDVDFKLEPKKAKPFSALLLEAPGKKTLEKNVALFNKGKRYSSMRASPFWAAIALYTLSIYASKGGAGHRVGLRGGGPLTTLIKQPTLWQTLWSAVLEEHLFLGDEAERWRNAAADQIFPWLRPCLTSEQKQIVPVNSSHPATVYWAVPRRLRLMDPVFEPGICDISGELADCFFTQYVTKIHGNNYGDGWQHPLTPHYQDKDKVLKPIHGQPGGIGYRHYLGLVMNSGKDTNSRRQPARIVDCFMSDRAALIRNRDKPDLMPTLWILGYDVHEATARSWIDQTLPIITVKDHERAEDFEDAVHGLVMAAYEAAGNLRKAVRNCLFHKKSKIKGDLTLLDEAFWRESQPRFFVALEQLADDPAAQGPRECWLQDLLECCRRLYDYFTSSRPVHQTNPKRWAIQRSNLIKYTHPQAKRMRKWVNLPAKKPQRSTPK